eukprot:m.1048714 g.1048714  ORF g.1048714 m.1048714 type:complete len:727 (-) comp24172_c0_seq54:2403-4583(-)
MSEYQETHARPPIPYVLVHYHGVAHLSLEDFENPSVHSSTLQKLTNSENVTRVAMRMSLLGIEGVPLDTPPPSEMEIPVFAFRFPIFELLLTKGRGATFCFVCRDQAAGLEATRSLYVCTAAAATDAGRICAGATMLKTTWENKTKAIVQKNFTEAQLLNPLITRVAHQHGRLPIQILLYWLIRRWKAEMGCLCLPRSFTPPYVELLIGIENLSLSDADMLSLLPLARDYRYTETLRAQLGDRRANLILGEAATTPSPSPTDTMLDGLLAEEPPLRRAMSVRGDSTPVGAAAMPAHMHATSPTTHAIVSPIDRFSRSQSAFGADATGADSPARAAAQRTNAQAKIAKMEAAAMAEAKSLQRRSIQKGSKVDLAANAEKVKTRRYSITGRGGAYGASSISETHADDGSIGTAPPPPETGDTAAAQLFLGRRLLTLDDEQRDFAINAPALTLQEIDQFSASVFQVYGGGALTRDELHAQLQEWFADRISDIAVYVAWIFQILDETESGRVSFDELNFFQLVYAVEKDHGKKLGRILLALDCEGDAMLSLKQVAHVASVLQAVSCGRLEGTGRTPTAVFEDQLGPLVCGEDSVPSETGENFVDVDDVLDALQDEDSAAQLHPLVIAPMEEIQRKVARESVQKAPAADTVAEQWDFVAPDAAPKERKLSKKELKAAKKKSSKKEKATPRQKRTPSAKSQSKDTAEAYYKQFVEQHRDHYYPPAPDVHEFE